MKDIDWSKAPEGATHYGPGGGAWVASWYIVGENTLATMLDDGMDDEWDSREIDPEDRFSLIPTLISRPTTPQWNGTGLPPVGVVCEVDHEGAWYETTIVGYDPEDGAVIFKTHERCEVPYDGYTTPTRFRPIRTPEQIAAEEREVAVQAMQSILCRLPAGTRLGAETLYDAGYRKTSGGVE